MFFLLLLRMRDLPMQRGGCSRHTAEPRSDRTSSSAQQKVALSVVVDENQTLEEYNRFIFTTERKAHSSASVVLREHKQRPESVLSTGMLMS